MDAKPSPQEKQILAAIWDDPPEPKGPALDFTRQALIKNAEPETGPETVARAAEALRELLGWPDWARLYSKPSLAVLAASRLARARGLDGGVLWMAPGTGRHFDPPRGRPGLAMLRGDWAPDAASMQQAQAEARERGLMLVLDECLTGLRLSPGGARDYYGLEPDLVMYGPPLAGGLEWGALAGVGQAPPEPSPAPDPAASALALATLKRAGAPEFSRRLAELGRLLAAGLAFFAEQAELNKDVYCVGPEAAPRLEGRRMWAFVELAKEEGLRLAAVLALDADLAPEEVPERLWPRLARAVARLQTLPEGEKAPLGWADAAESHTCLSPVRSLTDLGMD